METCVGPEVSTFVRTNLPLYDTLIPNPTDAPPDGCFDRDKVFFVPFFVAVEILTVIDKWDLCIMYFSWSLS